LRISERPIDAESDIAARGFFEIVAGEAAGDRDFGIAEIEPHEAAGAPCVIFLVAKRTALEPKREPRPHAKPEPRKAAIFLEGGAVSGVGREKKAGRDVELGLGLQPEAQFTALHRVMRVVRDDMLILGLDPGEELDDEPPRPELMAEQV
jgi:hypothetical protein